MATDNLIPESLLQPVNFADKARNYADKRCRELMSEARDRYRNAATGESNRDKALETALEWLQQESFKDPRLLGEMMAMAAPKLVQRNEAAELEFGIRQVRDRAKFLKERVDLDDLDAAEVQDLWHALLEPIRKLEVKDAFPENGHR